MEILCNGNRAILEYIKGESAETVDESFENGCWDSGCYDSPGCSDSGACFNLC